MYGHLRDYTIYSQQHKLHHSNYTKCAQHINTAQNKKVYSSTEMLFQVGFSAPKTVHDKILS